MMVEAACETEQLLHSVYDCNTDDGAMQAHTTDNDGSVSPKILRPIKGENYSIEQLSQRSVSLDHRLAANRSAEPILDKS